MEKLVYLHIPKCAGTSFHTHVSRFFHESRILPGQINWGPRFKDPGSNPSLYYGRYKHFDFHWGHFTYDHCQQIPGPKNTITVLRDPSDFLVSSYYMVRSFPDQTIENPTLKQVYSASKKSMLEFLNDTSHQVQSRVNNTMTRMIAGDYLAPDGSFSMPQEELLSKAKKNLTQLAVVGLTERLVDTVRILSHMYHWPAPRHLLSQNINSQKPEKIQINAQLLKRIDQLTNLDQELHKLATMRFNQQFSALFEGLTDTDIDNFLDNKFEKHATTRWPSIDKYHFQMDQALFGHGWHPREFYKNLVWRWTGPTEISTIYFKVLPNKSYNLKLNIAAWMSSDILDGTRISVNDIEINYCAAPEWGYDGTMFVGQIPSAATRTKSGLLKLTIKTPPPITPQSVVSENLDIRKLGIQIRDIFIDPVL